MMKLILRRRVILLCLLLAGVGLCVFWELAGISARPVACVVDIDGTIINSRKRRPLEGARETLNWLKERGIAVFYLTSRVDHESHHTETQLKEFDFPFARGFLIMRRPGDGVNYKINKIKLLQESYRIIFGVGDKISDMQAYQSCGIVPIRVLSGWPQVRLWIERILEVERVGINPAGKKCQN